MGTVLLWRAIGSAAFAAALAQAEETRCSPSMPETCQGKWKLLLDRSTAATSAQLRDWINSNHTKISLLREQYEDWLQLQLKDIKFMTDVIGDGPIDEEVTCSFNHFELCNKVETIRVKTFQGMGKANCLEDRIRTKKEIEKRATAFSIFVGKVNELLRVFREVLQDRGDFDFGDSIDDVEIVVPNVQLPDQQQQKSQQTKGKKELRIVICTKLLSRIRTETDEAKKVALTEKLRSEIKEGLSDMELDVLRNSFPELDNLLAEGPGGALPSRHAEL